MNKLNFYTIPEDYIRFLQEAEYQARGFSRVPNLDYGKYRAEKFTCGILFTIEDIGYFAPISSYKVKKPDNFLILNESGEAIASIRFNYMFPVPLEIARLRVIGVERNAKYRRLLFQELSYCRENQDRIISMAKRTYKRVLQKKNPGLLFNSCDFKLLEQRCSAYARKLQRQKDDYAR